MQPNMRENAIEDDEIDIRRLLGILFENRWLITAVASFFLILSVAYVLIASPVYEADALVQVEPPSSGLSGLTDLTSLLSQSDALSVTEIDIIQSRLVLGQAVDKENLTTNIEVGGLPVIRRFSGLKSSDLSVSHFEVSNDLIGEKIDLVTGKGGSYTLSYDGDRVGEGHVGKMFSANNGALSLMVDQISAPPDSKFALTFIPRQLAIQNLSDVLAVAEQGKQSGIIQLQLRGKDKDKIVRTVASVAQAYVQQNIQRRAEEAKKSLDFLRDQLPKVKADLYRSEEALNAFRLQRGSLNMELEAKSVLEQSSILQLQLSDLAEKQAQISHVFTPQHPAYRALLDQRASVERQLETLKQRVADLPDSQQKLLRLTRDVEVNEQLYLQMFDKIQELDVVRAGTVGNVRVLDFAAAQWKPVRPLKVVTVLAATFLGIVLGFALAIIRELMNPGLENAEELEAADLSVLAVVPISMEQSRIEKEYRRLGQRVGVGGDKKKRSRYLLGVVRSEDTAIEALRSLRTSLQFSLLEARNNIIMISGPSPEVGKTFVSANLAVVIAHSGQRVLLIDADLRRGTIHELFNMPSHQGMSEYLSGKMTRDAVIVKSGTTGLDVIGRGSAPVSPAELIMRPAMSELLDWASANYDIVLIDTPPILAVTDAAIIGRYAGTTLLIVRHRLNSVREVQLTVRRFAQNGVHVNGCVLNCLDRGVGGYGYKYGYYAYDYKSTRGDESSS